MHPWRKVKLGDLLLRSKIPIDIEDKKTYSRVTIRTKHQGVSKRDDEVGKKIGTKKQFLLKSGQFVMSKIDARYGAFGIADQYVHDAIITGNFWAYDINQELTTVEWIERYTNSSSFYDLCERASSGITHRKYLDEKVFLAHELNIPSKEDQSNILLKLEKEQKSLNELATENKNQSSYLKKLRQAILQEAIEGKLTADWRKENPVRKGDPDYDAEALLEKIQAEKEKLITEGKIKKQKPLAPIKLEEVPFDLPEGWIWTRLGEVGFINPRNYIDENLEVSFTPMPLVSAKFGVKPQFEIRKWSQVKNGFTHFAENDVAIAKITPCFENSKAGVFKQLKNRYGAGTTELHVLRPIVVLSDYIYINIKTTAFLDEGAKLMTGAVGQRRVPVDYFSNHLIPLPPIAEQQAIVDRVGKLLSIVDKLEEQVSERKEQSEQLMQAVLREAFEGG